MAQTENLMETSEVDVWRQTFSLIVTCPFFMNIVHDLLMIKGTVQAFLCLYETLTQHI